jgi:hypothetical protein
MGDVSMGHNASDSLEGRSLAMEMAPEASTYKISSPQPKVRENKPVAGESFSPQLIKTAQLSLSVLSVQETMATLEALTQQAGGMVTHQSMSVSADGRSYRQGRLEVRIPQADLESFVNQLKDVGTVMNQQVTGRDVSAELVDDTARLKNLRAEEAALQGIMNRAGKIPEVLEVARELARVRGDIESTQGRLNYLQQQVAFSTVTLTLTEENLTTPDATKAGLDVVISNTFKQAVNALDELVRTVIRTSIWLGVYLLPVLLLLFLLFWGGLRILVWGLPKASVLLPGKLKSVLPKVFPARGSSHTPPPPPVD